MLSSLLFALAMATASLALPRDPPPSNDTTPHYFSLQMLLQTLPGVFQKRTLGLLTNNTGPEAYLVVTDPIFSPSMGAYLTGSNPHKQALQLNVSGTDWGVDVADIGNLQDVAVAVTASVGYQEFEFQEINGLVYHELSSGSNVWLACNRLVAGRIRPTLNWGAMAAGGYAPEGCEVTSLYQNFKPFEEE